MLALLRPECDVMLVEPMARRAAFLTECVAELGLARVQVVRGRAEDLAGELSADIVTARAVAPLGKLAGWAVGLCRPGGTVLAIKGAGARDEVAQAGPELRQLGVTDVEVLQVGSDEVDPPATVVRFRAPAGGARPPAVHPVPRPVKAPRPAGQAAGSPARWPAAARSGHRGAGP